MAKSISKPSFKTSRRNADARLVAFARKARADLSGWIRRQGGMGCSNSKTMEAAAESLLLYGTVQSTARNLRHVQQRLDILLRRLRPLRGKLIPVR